MTEGLDVFTHYDLTVQLGQEELRLAQLRPVLDEDEVRVLEANIADIRDQLGLTEGT